MTDTADRAALRDARTAIVSLPEDALGRDPQHGWPYRDELLTKIDAALATPARAVPSEAAKVIRDALLAAQEWAGNAANNQMCDQTTEALAALDAVDFPHGGEREALVKSRTALDQGHWPEEVLKDVINTLRRALDKAADDLEEAEIAREALERLAAQWYSGATVSEEHEARVMRECADELRAALKAAKEEEK